MFTPFAFIKSPYSFIPTNGLLAWWDAASSNISEVGPDLWYDKVSNQLLEGTADLYPTYFENGGGSYFSTETNEYFLGSFSLPSTSSPFTVLLWAYVDNTSQEGLFQLGLGSVSTNIQISADNSRFQGIIANDAATIGGGDTNDTFSINTWYQIALTFDGTNINLYVNNTSQDSSTLSGVMSVPSSSPINLFFVDRSSGGDFYGNGSRIANLLIWNYALSLNAIDEIFNGYKGNFGY